MVVSGDTPDRIVLRPAAGPEADALAIPGDRPVSIGRAADCDICLMDDAISRRHATIMRRAGIWFVIHRGTRGITSVNGVHLAPADPTALANGDILRLGPRAFRVDFGDSGGEDTAVSTVDDARAPMQRVERASTLGRQTAADRRLRILTDLMERLGEIADEDAMASLTLEAAMAGSGYARSAVLRPAAGDRPGGVEVVATQRARPDDRDEFRFSRSLIESAAGGEAVTLSRADAGVASHSIAELGIHSALCAPIFLGRAVARYLYLDARGQETRVHADSAGFCEAVAKAYGLALAETKRLELERRQAELAAELQAAREVQQLLVPPAEGDLGFLAYAVEMRPGLFVAGDLFDVIRLDDGRVAVCMGDATGHGAASAMMMALTQSHLHAELRRDGDPAAAVSAVNRYMSQRSAGGRFVSLWIGVFDRDGSVRYVDAGHGHWLVGGRAEPLRRVQSASGIPVGIDADHPYQNSRVLLSPGDRLVVYSDGLVEQRDQHGHPFGNERLLAAIGAGLPARPTVDAVFAALAAFAGASTLDDDATLAVVEVRG
jgi:sigma-B regulation protein RsbU (phosphoserine phosphatase)